MARTQSAQILLVARRDPQDPVRRILKSAGYAVLSIDSPASVVRTAERTRPAAIVVEPGALGGPSADALSAFADQNDIPLIRDWVGPEALLAEVEKVLGQPGAAIREAPQIIVGPLTVDLAGHVALIGGSRLDLTSREFDLLCHLARHPGWVYSRQELLEQVWGYEFGDPRVVTVHMANLRKKLDAAAPGTELIETVRNVGYKLAAAAPTDASAGAPRSLEPVLESPARPADAAEPATGPRHARGRSIAQERRLVTVLFAHIGGLADLAEEHDLGSVGKLIGDLFGLLSSCMESFGGGLDRLGPDTFVSLFGAPVAHETDGQMAIRAALQARQTVAGFSDSRAVQGLSVHIGMNTGVVVAGSMGDESPYSVMGEAMDGAACLAGIAGPGEVLAGVETVRVAAGVVESGPGGTVTIRGRQNELIYERVTGVKPQRESTLTGRGIESTLVGREEQLALLRACLDRLADGVGGVVFVIGEAGVGKSRLVAEVQREAAERSLKWLEARALSYGQNLSYLPFRELVQADCGINPGDSALESERKLRERLQRLFADKSGEFLPLLGNLLGIAADTLGGYEPFPPEEEGLRKVMTEIAGRYALRISTERPAVFVFEDIQWLDRSSATLIENLMALNASAPMLACMVGRGGPGSLTIELLEAARRIEGLTCTEIQLHRLTKRQARQLVRNLLSTSEVEPQVMNAVQSRGEGNPFFIEEILRHLIESGSLQRDRRADWKGPRGVADLAIPLTIQGVLTARIDSLAEGPRQGLLRASVIGRSFSRALLRDLTGYNDHDLDQTLISLHEHQFIVTKREEPEPEYAFKHALVQEAAYATLLPKQRKELHRGVAGAIQAHYKGQVTDLYGILAYHYTKAEDWDNAQNFLLKAGDQSVSLAADGEAVAHYKEAMAALLRSFDERAESATDENQVSWFVTATEPFWLARCLGDLVDSAQVFYDKVVTDFGPSDSRTLAATSVLAGCHVQKGAYATATLLVEGALEALRCSGRTEDPSLARLLLLLGLCRIGGEQFSEAEQIFERALDIEDSKNRADSGVLQDLYIFLSSVHFLTGRHDELRRVTEEALERFDLEGTQRGWMLLINLASADMVDGRWDEAATLAQKCVDGIRNPYLWAVAARHLGEIRFSQGAFLEAEEHFGRAISVLEELSEPPTRFETMAKLAEAQLQAGKIGKAEETVRELLKLMEATCADSFEAQSLWTLAGIDLARGVLEHADVLLQKSAEIVGEKYAPRHPFCVELLFRRAQLRARQGQQSEAEEDFQSALRLMAEIGGDRHPRIIQMRTQWHAKELTRV